MSSKKSDSFIRYIHPSLEIPSAAQKILFPNPSLSILQFLQFPLPIISAPSTEHAAASFFDNEAPTTYDISLISKIPTPHPTVVTELARVCKAAITSGSSSVSCPHAALAPTNRLPLWILTYWTEVISLRAARAPWVRAEESLQKRNRGWKKSKSLIDEAYLALSTLPWSGNIQGFSNEEPISTLARYATHEWLTDVHENQMLDLLRRDLALDLTGGMIEIANLAFMVFIERGYKARESGEYAESNYFAHARGLGEALSCGVRKSVKLMKNLGNTHWVALDLDFKDSCILYGDSFGEEPPKDLMSAVKWWTHHHTGRHFSEGKLTITGQRDSFSCGLLAHNALAHSADPEKYPLIDAAAVDDARLKVLLAVIRRHSEQVVSAYCRFLFYLTRTNIPI
jgi:hypothetical protein